MRGPKADVSDEIESLKEEVRLKDNESEKSDSLVSKSETSTPSKSIEDPPIDESLGTNSEKGSNNCLCVTQLMKREIWLPLFLVCTVNLAQQVTGINAVFYYSAQIFKQCQIQEQYIQWAILGTGLINVFSTFLAVFLHFKLRE